MPRAVDFLDSGYHAVEMVFCLPIPGFVHDTRRDRFLAGLRQHTHDGAHCLKMGVTPEWHLIIASHGIRILPKVEVETPCFGIRKLTVDDLDGVCQLYGIHIVRLHSQCAFIFSALGLCRDMYFQPDWLCAVLHDIECLYDVERIGHQRGVPFRLVRAVAATTFTVFVQFVCHHVADKMGFDG